MKDYKDIKLKYAYELIPKIGLKQYLVLRFKAKQILDIMYELPIDVSIDTYHDIGYEAGIDIPCVDEEHIIYNLITIMIKKEGL